MNDSKSQNFWRLRIGWGQILSPQLHSLLGPRSLSCPLRCAIPIDSTALSPSCLKLSLSPLREWECGDRRPRRENRKKLPSHFPELKSHPSYSGTLCSLCLKFLQIHHPHSALYHLPPYSHGCSDSCGDNLDLNLDVRRH